MSNRTWLDPRVAQVRVGAVRSYLRQRGWTEQSYPGPELLVFGGPVDDDGEPVIQVVPSDETMLDYPMRIEELIGALSVLEDRPAADILTDLLMAASGPPNPPTPHSGVATPVTPSPAADR
jgi:hypothetical protein